jgi:murein L,D-transpeptidase YcbB/YkuD
VSRRCASGSQPRTAKSSPPADTFDAELKDAVVRAQRRYGLNPTGLVSTGTLGALNVPAADRVRQIMANMERWRWLPAELPAKRIQVNIAAAVLTVLRAMPRSHR